MKIFVSRVNASQTGVSTERILKVKGTGCLILWLLVPLLPDHLFTAKWDNEQTAIAVEKESAHVASYVDFHLPGPILSMFTTNCPVCQQLSP